MAGDLKKWQWILGICQPFKPGVIAAYMFDAAYELSFS